MSVHVCAISTGSDHYFYLVMLVESRVALDNGRVSKIILYVVRIFALADYKEVYKEKCNQDV